MANLTYRSIKGSPLTNDELDNNFSYFTGSFTNTGTITAIGFSGSFTGSLSGSLTGTANNALTASYITASNIVGVISSASYSATALSASYSATALSASYSATALSASYSATALSASYSATALSASYAPSTPPFPFTGNATFSGSILVSGSIIPNVPVGSSTSSFNLGSPTAAWKDIYVSNGTINFLNGAGQVQSTIGAGTNATVITGSLTTLPLNPLTGFANFSTLLHKSYTNSDCVFSLANASNSYTRNPEIYTNGSIIVLPWDKKITAYSLVNNCPIAAPSSPNPVVSLPPVYNAGYTSGDIITVYNMGEVEAFYRASGSIYVTATVSGVTAVDSGSKLITGTFNTSYIISGSWGNYTNLSSFISATTQSIKVDPGQKATFEVVYWGSSTPGPSASVAEFPENGYKTNMTNVNPSFTYLVYLFKGIENL
jgi:hypothetical protein